LVEQKNRIAIRKSEYESGYKKRIKEGRFKTNITTTCSLMAVTGISLGMAMGTL
jgi:hypothetical protein